MVDGGAVELPWRFSDEEHQRRRRVLEELAAAADVGAVLLCGAQRSGPAIPWLTGWPVTAEAHALVVPGEAVELAVSYVNHLPNARRLARGAEVVAGGRGVPDRVAAELDRRGIRRLGVVGALPWTAAGRLGRELVDLTPAWIRARLVKSPEEVDALRVAGAVTDAAMADLVAAVAPGVTEHDLQAAVQASYLRVGAMHHVSFLAVTSPGAPDRCVPAQWPSARRVGAGDVVTVELSAAVFPDLAGQLLRTIVVGAEVPPIVEELHGVAERCFDAVAERIRPGTTAAELAEASGVVEDAGCTTVDDVVHGYGGGYLPPVLSTRSRQPPSPVPDLRLEAGMALVVQPNVVTPDRTFGVQTGEMLLVTPDGPERLHHHPRGVVRSGRT